MIGGAVATSLQQVVIFRAKGWTAQWRANPVIFVAPDGVEYTKTQDLQSAHILYYHTMRGMPAIGLRQRDPFAISTLQDLDWITLVHITDQGW